MKKVKTKKIIDGKIDSAVVKKTPKTINDVLPFLSVTKYKTESTDEYSDYLKSMNSTDLQRHATEIGLLPIENKQVLIKRLMSEFNKYFALKKSTRSVDGSASSKPMRPELKEMLNRY